MMLFYLRQWINPFRSLNHQQVTKREITHLHSSCRVITSTSLVILFVCFVTCKTYDELQTIHSKEPVSTDVVQSDGFSATVSRCHDVPCNNHCEFGFQIDMNGCKTCNCLIEPRHCTGSPCGKTSCEFGLKRDAKKCQLCQCRSEPSYCPTARCKKSCQYGVARDKNGCKTCKCLSEPEQCPTVNCRNRCYFGHARDKDGCQTCRCLSAPRGCPRLACKKRCPLGYLSDKTGCKTCQCLPLRQSCPHVKCKRRCEFGLQRDRFGCQTCQCRSRESYCGVLTCDKSCQFGLRTNHNGCKTCTCLADWEACSAGICEWFCELGSDGTEYGCPNCRCPNETRPCPEVVCGKYCEFGFKTDSDGCKTCYCRSEPDNCPYVECGLYCEFGFRRNEFGCEICHCRSRPGHCPELMCEKRCEFGFREDERGCRTCKCHSQFPVCPTYYRCQMNCTAGFERDEYGCEICACKRSTPEEVCADVGCRSGYSCGLMMSSDCTHDICTPLPVCLKQKPDEKIKLRFELEHDINGDELDGATNDIAEHFKKDIEERMAVNSDSFHSVKVFLTRPGVLLLESTMEENVLSNITAATQYISSSPSSVKYKNHLLRLKRDTIHFEQHDGLEISGKQCRGFLCHRQLIFPLLIASVITFVVFVLSALMIFHWRRNASKNRHKFKIRTCKEKMRKHLLHCSEVKTPCHFCKDDIRSIFVDAVMNHVA